VLSLHTHLMAGSARTMVDDCIVSAGGPEPRRPSEYDK
jgi:hypothetical protein